MSDEVQKLQTHLSLLREEYVRLQRRLADVEKKYQVVLAANGQSEETNFVSRLLKTVSDLYDKELYSDLLIKIHDKEICGHRFVLAARSDSWGVEDLSQTTVLDLSEMPIEVGNALLKWVYTDQCDILQNSNDGFLLDLMRAAGKYKLSPLVARCEQSLMSSVTSHNCIKYYQSAEEIGAQRLRDHCSELISSHWNDFTSEDFSGLPASLAYQMFKSKTEHPLHMAVRAKREDVVFLYMMEFDSQLPGKLNEIDSRGDLPIDLALQNRLEGIAQTLVKHRADMNRPDQSGFCLLHKAIQRGDEYAAKFLIENKANVNASASHQKETPLHLTASFRPESQECEKVDGMARVAELLIKHGANPNAQDESKCTPLHRAIIANNVAVFSVLLEDKNLNLELQDVLGQTVLWLSLTATVPSDDDGYKPDSFPCRLINRGSSPNATNNESGDTMLHLAARCKNETAGLFLANHGSNANIANLKGETPLHSACMNGLSKLAVCLLEKGANANVQTTASLAESTSDPQICRQTPLHLAVSFGRVDIVKVLLEFKAKATNSIDGRQIIPNLTLKDSLGQTALGVALWSRQYNIAELLITGGANVNDTDDNQLTLLHQAIIRRDTESATFLLQHQSDNGARTPANLTCLQLGINYQLPAVVEVLCQKGANINVKDDKGDCALWTSLLSGQMDIASILVKHGCDTNVWGSGPNGCQQTLLHKSIDENNEDIACFLIKSKCDVNSPRKPGPNGEGDDEARDNQSPLHLCSTWGLVKVVQALIEESADVNARDVDGKTPLHIAIENQHHAIISLLLSHPALNVMIRDRHGLTPFAAAMTTRNNKAAQAILDREPTAAEQLDNKGRNFLHIAIQKGDMESVLFLISVHANINSRVQDSSQMTPLHLAVVAGAEMISRNLLLAGARVNDLTPQKQTALHLAALHDRPAISSILVENKIDYNTVDDALNNALHIAVQHGHLNVVRILLAQSHINAEAVNMRGQNALHILGQYGKENAAAIFELFLEYIPQYPIDQVDANGNTVLLLAYFNGNGALCRAVVRMGAMLGTVNREGLSIFNAPVATKQLLFKLLDMLSKEPAWSEGEVCLQCGIKFGIKTRKHHCRHCGRLLCAKCSDKDMPIIKYNIPKPVRVCEICFDVLTLGTS